MILESNNLQNISLISPLRTSNNVRLQLLLLPTNSEITSLSHLVSENFMLKWTSFWYLQIARVNIFTFSDTCQATWEASAKAKKTRRHIKASHFRLKKFGYPLATAPALSQPHKSVNHPLHDTSWKFSLTSLAASWTDNRWRDHRTGPQQQHKSNLFRKFCCGNSSCVITFWLNALFAFLLIACFEH